jgi:hypothetical protein
MSNNAASDAAGLPAPASSKTSAASYESDGRFSVAGVKAFLFQDVNPDLSTYPLAAYCFMTGYMYVPPSQTSLSKS